MEQVIIILPTPHYKGPQQYILAHVDIATIEFRLFLTLNNATGASASLFYQCISLCIHSWRQDRGGSATSCPALRGEELIRTRRCSTRRQNAIEKRRLPVYLTQEEYNQIAASASRVGISLSTFAKRVCLGLPVPSLEHKQAVQDIIKARADLGRLGGLLKSALADGRGPEHELRCLLREVEAGQLQLKTAAGKVR